MSILTSLVLQMSLLFLEKASPYSSHSSSNFCLISVVMFLSCSCTLWVPGTSAGEQIKAVSCGISCSVSCLCGTQFHGLARCSLILSSLASSMLYVSSTGCSAKAITVSLPMYMSCHQDGGDSQGGTRHSLPLARRRGGFNFNDQLNSSTER